MSSRKEDTASEACMYSVLEMPRDFDGILAYFHNSLF